MQNSVLKHSLIGCTLCSKKYDLTIITSPDVTSLDFFLLDNLKDSVCSCVVTRVQGIQRFILYLVISEYISPLLNLYILLSRSVSPHSVNVYANVVFCKIKRLQKET